jgi:hypothetical protein
LSFPHPLRDWPRNKSWRPMLAWRRDGTLPNKGSQACPPSVALA